MAFPIDALGLDALGLKDIIKFLLVKLEEGKSSNISQPTAPPSPLEGKDRNAYESIGIRKSRVTDYLNYDLTIRNDLSITCSSSISETINGNLLLDDQQKDIIEKALLEIKSIEPKLNRSQLKTVGQTLATALFPTDVIRNFSKVQGMVAESYKGIRLRLIIEPPQIAEYPWEVIYDNGSYMSISDKTTLVRYVPTGKPKKINFEDPLKILIIGSNPSSNQVPCTRLEEEIESIENALQNEIDHDLIRLKIIRIATIDRIWKQLRQDSYNIIHFIGHGLFKDGTGYLALVNSNGDVEFADHERIGSLFQFPSLDSLGLIVLNACETGATSTYKAFTGLAPQLINIGVPSVIAMRYNITNKMAHLFSQIFYTNLTKMPIDQNLQMARHRIFVDGDVEPRDFTAPVLFTSSNDGFIFNTSGTQN